MATSLVRRRSKMRTRAGMKSGHSWEYRNNGCRNISTTGSMLLLRNVTSGFQTGDPSGIRSMLRDVLDALGKSCRPTELGRSEVEIGRRSRGGIERNLL